MGAVDQHPPEPQLAHHLIQRSLADQKLLGHVTHAIERRPKQGKQIAFQLIPAAHSTAVCTRDVVAGKQDAHTADADEDAKELGGVVPDVEEEEGDGDNEDDGPEVDELGREDGGVAVGEDGEVVAFDVEE